jgi:hypothetical protein
MPGNNVEASIPVEDERNGERMSVLGKFAGMLKYLNPFSTMPPPPQDEDTPAAKRPRLQASATIISTAEDADTVVVDAHTTDAITTTSPNDTVAVAPTDAVPLIVASSLPSNGPLRASIPRRSKRPRLEASTNAVTVAASLPSTGALRAYTPRRAKRRRLQESTGISTAESAATVVDAHTTGTLTRRAKRPRLQASTDTVAAVTSLPSTGSLRAFTPRRDWTPEDDAALTDALTKYGTKWVKVVPLVPGRTKGQCIKRRQKLLDAIDPTTASKKGKWAMQQDANLFKAVKKHGENNWNAVATLVPGRTNHQCRQRWTTSLDPAINRGEWTVEEDANLTAAVKKHGGSNWSAVSALVPGRTNGQCGKRWLNALHPAINKGKWTVEEDASLTRAVKGLGSNWAAVSALVPSRTNNQCRNRWVLYVDPDRDPNAARDQRYRRA